MIWGSLIRGSEVKRRGQAGLYAGKGVRVDLLGDRQQLAFPDAWYGVRPLLCAQAMNI